MNSRATLALLLAAGTTVHAQNVFHITYSWSEVVAGTTTPVASPNSVIEPGEGALIRLHVNATINGADAIGQTLTYSGGPPPGVATGRCIGSIVYNFSGSGADATGAWNCLRMNPIFTFFPDPGRVTNGGANIVSLQGAPWLPPGSTADGTNPINSAWRGVWTPASYTPRVVHFVGSPSNEVPTGEQNALYTQFRTDYTDPTDPTTGYAVYWAIYFDSDFGAGIDIPIGSGFTSGTACYANCDQSTGQPILTVNDFQCFMNAFTAGQPYANCDHSTVQPVLNVNDFQCFLSKFASGCP